VPWKSAHQGLYLQTGQQKHRKNTHRYPCLEWDSNPWPLAGDGCSGHCDQQSVLYSIKIKTKLVNTKTCPVFCNELSAVSNNCRLTYFLFRISPKKKYSPAFYVHGARGSVVVKALCYKLEGRGFDTLWGEFLNLPNPSGRARPWGLLSL
jgi:hypothetical protein